MIAMADKLKITAYLDKVLYDKLVELSGELTAMLKKRVSLSRLLSLGVELLVHVLETGQIELIEQVDNALARRLKLSGWVKRKPGRNQQ